MCDRGKPIIQHWLEIANAYDDDDPRDPLEIFIIP